MKEYKVVISLMYWFIHLQVRDYSSRYYLLRLEVRLPSFYEFNRNLYQNINKKSIRRWYRKPHVTEQQDEYTAPINIMLLKGACGDR
jgi:hypothetical protein